MITTRCLVLWLITFSGYATATAVDAQTDQKLSGLLGTYSDSVHSFERVDHQVRWVWRGNRELDERLTVGQSVKATWTGWLEVPEDGEYRLSIFGLGSVQVSVNGQPVLDVQNDQSAWAHGPRLVLPFGQHELKISYLSPPDRGLLKLYWEGPGFQLEPIAGRYLKRSSIAAPTDQFERGRMLAHALRCSACHDDSGQRSIVTPAADLRALKGNLQPEWLMDWLTSQAAERPQTDDHLQDDLISRRMPHLSLSQQDAADITAALYAGSHPLPSEQPLQDSPTSASASADVKKKDKIKPTKPDAKFGRQLLLTRGCVACHSLAAANIGMRDEDDEMNELAERRWDYFTYQLFAGGDLSDVGTKRPAHFFARWLSQPEKINADHRMPLANLESIERDSVALYLASLKSTADSSQLPAGDAQRGVKLIADHRCGHCHQLPATLSQSLRTNSRQLKALAPESNWNGGCLTQANSALQVPGFGLTAGQRDALREYWLRSAPHGQEAQGQEAQGQETALRPGHSDRPLATDIALAQHNCVACHARDLGAGLGTRATVMIRTEVELAASLPAMLPPSLTGVGDKLHDSALASAIERPEARHRPWLEIRMPGYRMNETELSRVVNYLVDHDRIAELPEHRKQRLPDDVVTRAAAGRLVTSEGFGCQSCHQIGNQPSPTVALSARGTDLTMLGNRLRQSWFDRWVRNPVRIVPRMEMPAIKLPVHGVMNNDLNRQIDAVWEMLNTPGFQPPAPAPVRVVRGHNDPQATLPETANVLTDVLETSDAKYLRPLILGLGNRHNMLFDLERAQLGKWWIGDTARELTRGKSWYWELGGQPLAARAPWLWQLNMLDRDQQVWIPQAREQFAVELDHVEHTLSGVKWRGRLYMARESQRQTLPLEMAIEPQLARTTNTPAEATLTGLKVDVKVELPADARLLLELHTECGELHHDAATAAVVSQLDERSSLRFGAVDSQLHVATGHQLQISATAGSRYTEFTVALETTWPVDSVVRSNNQLSASATSTQQTQLAPKLLKVVPGFEAVQLPLPRTEMPTALAWYKGQLAIGSLKGRVCLAIDSDGDSLSDTWQAISDDLPAPYGLAAFDGGLDVLAKYGLMRLTDPRQPDSDIPWPMETVADGWGYTADYHDWAVGLQRDVEGNYWIALPCQQDDRSESAARLRGTIQKLTPQTPTTGDPRRFRLETVAAGQRFPMGLAIDRQGRLFATDNQGNYNPFNELNHIQLGKRYGFINKLENKPGFNPPLESPAINLPHPWTRSVNGICFLNTPASSGQSQLFGPFEGHLIGCEYNGLSLIRMSLEEVDGAMQGAAYMFSRPPVEGEATFEGPVVCAVSPTGKLTIGNIHDSGWGGGQNTGSIVELSPTGQWSMGIASVTALHDGLRIQFTGPLDQSAAAASNYSIRSYRRISTPAYGGNDQDERMERILAVRVDPSQTAVELQLSALRADTVYEVRVGQVAGDRPLFPNEAHYTMKRVPRP